MTLFAGADYGAKLAGTTVLAFVQNETIQFLQSEKKRDADAFLHQNIQRLHINQLFLDAPLSLPGVYQKLPNHHDYFYREADKALNAMSAMFLGGLTARAMRLQHQLALESIEVIETYPAYWAKQFGLKEYFYKKQKMHLAACTAFLLPQLDLPYKIAPIENWHQMDALLAFYSAWRHQKGESIMIGNKEEGGIRV